MEEKIFKKDFKERRKKRTKLEKFVLVLTRRFTELNEVLPCINDPIDKTSMKYLSCLYTETLGLIRYITVFMVREKYCGVHAIVDDYVIKSQNLVGILKGFKYLDSYRKVIGYIDEDSQEKASSLLKSLRDELDEFLQLKMVIERTFNFTGK